MTDYERFGDYQPSDRKTWGLAITMLLVGIGAGALTALLLAPQTGAETRDFLRRKYDDTVDNFGDLRERGSEWFGKAKDLADDVSEASARAGSKVREYSREYRKRR